jgi:hypothetical protein
LAFISQVSKQINSICKKLKQQLGIQLTIVVSAGFQVYFAQKGFLNCMIYVNEHGCKWREETCRYAAMNGHLEVLKYAHENGCPWDDRICSIAASNGHLECLKYAWRWFGDLLVVPGGCSDLAQLMPTACFHAHFLCAVPDVGYV